MRKKFLITFVLLLTANFANPSFAYKVTTFQPLQPAQPAQPATGFGDLSNAQGAYESYPKITQIENILFNKGYDRENIYNRLGRIETRMFRRQFQNMPLASRMDNILSNIDEGQMYGIASNDLSKMESKLFGQTFAGEDTNSRVTRLEKEMLGAMQNGNLKQRYEVVKSASRHYNAFPQQTARNSAFTPNNYYNPSQRQSIVTRLLDTIAGGFNLGAMNGMSSMGSMTGYTPPIYDQYSQYGQQYPGNGAGMQDYYMGNNGGRYNNRNIGSGAGIRILN